MAHTPEHYWEEHIQDSLTGSLFTESPPGVEAMVSTYGKGNLKANIQARAWFSDEEYLEIHEKIKITPKGPRRRKYSYHLEIVGVTWKRWDFDPALGGELRWHINEPPDIHEPDKRRTLKQVVRLCWDIVDEHRNYEAEDQSDDD